MAAGAATTITLAWRAESKAEIGSCAEFWEAGTAALNADSGQSLHSLHWILRCTAQHAFAHAHAHDHGVATEMVSAD